MDNNLWTRRTNSGKLSLSTNGSPAPGGDAAGRNGSFAKRFGGDTSSHGGKSNPFNNVTTPSAGGMASPTAGAANAFGLGSGAFASFGSAKTPKSPGNPFDLAMGKIGSKPGGVTSSHDPAAKAPSVASIPEKKALGSQPVSARTSSETLRVHPLKYEWVTWCRPPQPKGQPYQEYAKSLTPMIHCNTVEEFWVGYPHLKRPSELSVGWEYHFFKRGIRPIWEDEENRSGGKWVLRLKKGIVDRYWEDTVFALLGEAFIDASEEVCGGVVSVRNGEDIISIWTRSTGGRVLRIRETWKSYLKCPPNTQFEFKSHDESIQHRAAIEESRREKQHDKRGKQATEEQKTAAT
ncbi:Eukaryotic translation initiation factor 4E type 2 [Colletotrichum tanaceti]|uniref:Eukaryotic translation initiation factor 4E type 2 n=1 Tax=Colletotrichum tanaceti TaxID=1306861 RepID=A0A4U6XAT4_9PEZI|nr:Eukaryotic translation initiation factor 4E type 2 [Colletotrichum tanaceti]TKW52791.1 Eukaryotic translation initiation factor 4E type 2 [Colletotrichum tanaceti]